MSTIGLDETKIRKYVKYLKDKERQEKDEQKESGILKSSLKATGYAGK